MNIANYIDYFGELQIEIVFKDIEKNGSEIIVINSDILSKLIYFPTIRDPYVNIIGGWHVTVYSYIFLHIGDMNVKKENYICVFRIERDYQKKITNFTKCTLSHIYNLFETFYDQGLCRYLSENITPIAITHKTHNIRNTRKDDKFLFLFEAGQGITVLANLYRLHQANSLNPSFDVVKDYSVVFAIDKKPYDIKYLYDDKYEITFGNSIEEYIIKS